jgi:xanthine/uracil/vitamin C permease (AzgA family)
MTMAYIIFVNPDLLSNTRSSSSRRKFLSGNFYRTRQSETTNPPPDDSLAAGLSFRSVLIPIRYQQALYGAAKLLSKLILTLHSLGF